MGKRTADHPIAARRRLRDDQELDIRLGAVSLLIIVINCQFSVVGSH